MAIKDINDYKRQLRREIRDARAMHPDYRISEEHIEGCQVFTSRNVMMSHVPSGGIGAELGVNRGRFSKEIMRNCDSLIVHFVDCWGLAGVPGYDDDMAEAIELLKPYTTEGLALIHRAWILDYLATVNPRYFDWVYLDASHTYENVSQELAILEGKMKPDGLIMGHDYTSQGPSPKEVYGVVPAVHEFCVTRGWRFKYLALCDRGHMSYALEKMP